MTRFLILYGFFWLTLSVIVPIACADNELQVMRQIKMDYPDWEPRGIIDAGANSGDWSKLAHKIYPNAKIFMVEAFPKHDEILKQVVQEIGTTTATHRISVLSTKDGENVKFYSSPSSFTTGNSMFKENSEHYSTIQFTEHITSRLDSLIPQASPPFSDLSTYDYLKLDVQGAEFVVLQGAENILRQVTFIQLEVSLIQYNQGAACWGQVDELLRSHGFYLYDLADFIRNDAFHSKGIGQMDVLYIRPTSEALPVWLKNNKLNMCGSSEFTSQQFSAKATTSESGNHEAPPSMIQLILPSVATVAFFIGISIGKWSEKRKLDAEPLLPRRDMSNYRRRKKTDSPATINGK